MIPSPQTALGRLRAGCERPGGGVGLLRAEPGARPAAEARPAAAPAFSAGSHQPGTEPATRSRENPASACGAAGASASASRLLFLLRPPLEPLLSCPPSRARPRNSRRGAVLPRARGRLWGPVTAEPPRAEGRARVGGEEGGTSAAPSQAGRQSRLVAQTGHTCVLVHASCSRRHSPRPSTPSHAMTTRRSGAGTPALSDCPWRHGANVRVVQARREERCRDSSAVITALTLNCQGVEGICFDTSQ